MIRSADKRWSLFQIGLIKDGMVKENENDLTHQQMV